MPLTLSITAAAVMSSSAGKRRRMPLRRRSLPTTSARFLGAVALGDLLLGRVLLGRGADHRLDDLLIGGIDLLADHPLPAVPGVDGGLRLAGMVHAARRKRRHEA